jgi:hypothetical protein
MRRFLYHFSATISCSMLGMGEEVRRGREGSGRVPVILLLFKLLEEMLSS